MIGMFTSPARRPWLIALSMLALAGGMVLAWA
ncbi:hypothetical protein BH09PSE4_BH09PSE4_23680 [soil metagenome]